MHNEQHGGGAMKETKAVMRYKVFRVKDGLLLEPQEDWGGARYNDYETMEEAAEAIRVSEANDQGLVVLPQVFVSPNYWAIYGGRE